CWSGARWGPACRNTWCSASGPPPTWWFTNRPRSTPFTAAATSRPFACAITSPARPRNCPVRPCSCSSGPNRRRSGCRLKLPGTPMASCSPAPTSSLPARGRGRIASRARWRRAYRASWRPGTSAQGPSSVWASRWAMVPWRWRAPTDWYPSTAETEGARAAMDAHAESEATFTGRSISPGLAMGPAWVVSDPLHWDGPTTSIAKDDIEKELLRLRHAFEETLAELDQYAQRIEGEFDAALAGIFRAHGEMLRSLFASGELERELRESLLTAEGVVGRVLQRWHRKIEAIENPTLRQRADDVLDLGRNVIRRLRGEQGAGFQAVPEGSVLVAQQLLPSDIVRMPRTRVAAVVVEALGQGSHAALLAREKGIPTVAGFPGILSRIGSRTELLVDGFRGTLVVAPREDTRTEFQGRIAQWRGALVRCQAACHQPARTLDGQQIDVEANVGIADDMELALDNGADGIGLLRIEQLYLARPSPLTEEELWSELERLISPPRNPRLTIRLRDIGGDKPLPYLGLPPSPNPTLGRRGVRLLLDYAQLVRTQMGAILRLAQEHPVQVLIPMV